MTPKKMVEKTKTLLLARHAKSSWKSPGLADHDRPLNKRGKHDAPVMGNYVKSKYHCPNIILSSTALCAITTAKMMAHEMEYDCDKILTKKEIYGAWPHQLLEIIQSMNNSIESAMIIGHNPTMTELIEEITNHGISNVPTCGIAIIQFQTQSWSDIGDCPAILQDFIYPKLINPA